jgi:hypothetical protein
VLGSSDLIADAIGLLRPRTVVDPGFHAAGEWVLRFDRFPHVKLGIVARGECWLILEGRDPVLLEEGDFWLLGNPRPMSWPACSARHRVMRAARPRRRRGCDSIRRVTGRDGLVPSAPADPGVSS